LPIVPGLLEQDENGNCGDMRWIREHGSRNKSSELPFPVVNDSRFDSTAC
jgi:hypothetical protein